MNHQLTPKISGIYQIKNILSRESYIGSATNLRGRHSLHLRDLHKGKHHNRRLQNAWAKYGNDAFDFIVLEEVPDKSRLIEREQFFLDALLPEYNHCGTAGSTQGRTHGPEVRAKIGQASRGRTITPEWRANLSRAGKGRKRSPEAVEKGRQALLGRKHTPERREKVRQANQSPSAREKNRQAHLGRKLTAEAKEKIGQANRSRVFTPEMRAKRSEIARGHVVTAETRKKISESVKRTLQSRKKLLNAK